MKKYLRLFCMGLAAAIVTTGFAQGENVTSKLRNVDMAQGVAGWMIEGDQGTFYTQNKPQLNYSGYHGINNQVLENWVSASTALPDCSLYQRVKNLAPGTYVFGAYVAACLQGTDESNREEVVGVSVFANEDAVPAATDNPEKTNFKWAHSSKFNVATKVAEEGTLDVGIKVELTTANFVILDNATLWYFGDMDPEQALNEMAKLDVAASIAILDTCLTHKMNADTVALVNEAIEKGKALTTADELFQVDEDLYWAIFKANRSLRDYNDYHNIIVDAEEAMAAEWSEYVAEQKAALEIALAEAKENYEAAIMAEPELVLAGEDLREAIAQVELDSLYIMLDIVSLIPDQLEEEGLIGDELGQYSEDNVQILMDLEEEAREVLAMVEAGDMTAIEGAAYIKKLQDGINTLYASANYFDEFPLHVGEADGTLSNIQNMGSGDQYHFTSKTYFLGDAVKTLRFTFDDCYTANNGDPHNDKNGNPSVAIAEFYLYDGDGFQIELTAENFSTNAQEPSEGPIANICDGSLGSFWHSMWSTATAAGVKHYIEVTLPDGLDLTSFAFGWISRHTAFVIPNNVTVTKISNIETDLRDAIDEANGMHVAQGTDPGFVNQDLSAFFAAIAEGEALKGTTASDAEKSAAIDAINAEMAKLEDVAVELPVAGKKYRIISGLYGFYEKQGVHKALASRNDTLWWMDANAESAMQEFEFEPIANEAGEPLYKVKNVGSGNYLNKLLEYYDADSTKYVRFPLSANYDTIKLASLGDGVFHIMDMSNNKLHANRHNGGSLTTDSLFSHGEYYGIIGEETGIIAWDEGRNSASAWYIREMQTLPCTLTPVSDVYTLHLFSSINTLSLTADKDCAFADLKFYDVFGKSVDASKYSVNVSGKVAVVMFDGITFESLQFTFTNNEGVSSIEVNGSISKLSELQTKYDEAVAVAPEEGEGVMQYKDLTAYKAAIANAEKLLTSGATDEEVDAAIASLEAAVAGLQPNMPVAGKAYYIVNAFPKFEAKQGVQMMMYDNGVGSLRWSYENTVNPDRQWLFEAAPVEEGAPAAFYIQNVATGSYMGMAESGTIPTAPNKESAQSYTIVPFQGSIVAIVGTYSGAKDIHCESHNDGAGRLGNIVTWNDNVNSASAWRICAVETYGIEDAIENIEISEETENIVKGIYDLFGRKVQNPEKGIYIIDGKKRVVR